MKNSKRVMTLVITIALLLTSVTSVAFADTTVWNSQPTYPSDVVNTPLFTSVKFLIDKKVMTGYPDGTFKPDNLITRAEIAVAVAKMTNRTNNLDAMASKNIFTDLTEYDWAKGHINALVDAKIIKGTTATTYAPAKNITYAELITILVRTNAGAASELENSGTWPDNYIQYVKLYNFLGDIVITDWNAPATRGDTARLMYRFMPKN